MKMEVNDPIVLLLLGVYNRYTLANGIQLHIHGSIIWSLRKRQLWYEYL